MFALYDIGEVDGRHFLSMEFVKGEDFRRSCTALGDYKRQATQIARQICAACGGS